jgi:hypothetical protein
MSPLPGLCDEEQIDARNQNVAAAKADYLAARALVRQTRAQILRRRNYFTACAPCRDTKDYAEKRPVQWTNVELRRLIPEEAPLWTTATTMVAEREIVEKIIATSEKLHVDLIIMGANPASSLWPVYGDHTMYNVIADAKYPVLTLRPAETKPEKGACVPI